MKQNLLFAKELTPYIDCKLTPTETRDNYHFKRDDMFSVAGIAGGKGRTCWELAKGANGLVTAGSRQSPQVNIVAQIAKELGIPCRVHVPTGAFTPELISAQAAGATVIQHRPGYNSVIVARAKQDAIDTGLRLIPFGMECWEAVRQTMSQVANIPKEIKRIVMPVGSGMSLAGVLTGVRHFGLSCRVLGVLVGADPTNRLKTYAPFNWSKCATLETSELNYHTNVIDNSFKGIVLDTVYEAKCIPFLQEGDLLWIVGIRQTLQERGVL